MHIETTAGQLKKALRLVKPVIPRWVRVPVLACVRITASGGAGRVDATDLDIFYSVDFAVIGYGPDGVAGGEVVFLIDHAVLLRLVSNLPTAETVRLETAQRFFPGSAGVAPARGGPEARAPRTDPPCSRPSSPSSRSRR